jgi:sulfatase modifying factor 1
VSWGDAARFVNWVSNGQPVGAEEPATTETGTYALNGATTDAALTAVDRAPGAAYALPTENEWYKAAYYKGGSLNAGYWAYPTRSNAGPSNTLSAVGRITRITSCRISPIRCTT